MTIYQLIRELTKNYHRDIYEQLDYVRGERDIFSIENKQLLEELNNERAISENKEKVIEDKQRIIEGLSIRNTIPVDDWLSRQFVSIPNFAYKQKRQVTIKQDRKKTETSGTYSVFLNELITPDAFEVLKYKKQFDASNRYLFYSNVAQKFTTDNIWVSEPDLYKTGDIYLQPSEVLTFMLNTLDCDDCAHLLVSLMPKYAASVLGFFIDDNGNEYGHAYPIFLDEDDNVWIVETTGATGEIIPFNDKHYRHHFIYTKDKTYQIRNDIQFGYLDSL
jgi:hypothetical protein